MIKKQKLYVLNIVHNMTVYDGRVRLMVNAAFTKVPNTVLGKQGIQCKNGAKYDVDVRRGGLTRVLAAQLIDAPRSEAELIAAKEDLLDKMVADLGIRRVLDDGSENFSSMVWSIGDASKDADHLMDDEAAAHIRKATEDAICRAGEKHGWKVAFGFGTDTALDGRQFVSFTGCSETGNPATFFEIFYNLEEIPMRLATSAKNFDRERYVKNRIDLAMSLDTLSNAIEDALCGKMVPKSFQVKITETLQKVVLIEDDNVTTEEEALTKARERWRRGEYIFGDDDFKNVNLVVI